MNRINVAASALNQTPLDWENNERNIREAIRQAREQGVTILNLPELCITGYGCEDHFFSLGTQRQALAMLQRLLPETKGMAVSFGLPFLSEEGALYNTSCLAVDGEIAGFAAKQNLAGDGIHYEPRWFKTWPEGVRTMVNVNGKEVPFGDVRFNVGGVRIGFEICEDAWVAGRPGAKLARHGVDVILNPSASHFSFGKSATREGLILDGSRAFNVNYIYSNLLGNEAGRVIYDGGAMIASCGKALAYGPRLSFRDVLVTATTIDVDFTRMKQASTASFRPLIEPENGAVQVPFAWPEAERIAPATERAAWEKSPTLKEEEFTRAETLGHFDYLRKSGSQGFALSLSGGADSATEDALVKYMVDLGSGELGIDGFKAKLGHIRDLTAAATPEQLVNHLLTCAYQGGANSSETTRNAAQTLAEQTGARFLNFNIQPVVNAYTEMVSEGLGRQTSWEKDDLALQNIQARTRSPSIWMVANMEHKLLLTTSNRSEAAVGYATMDGDTSGSIAPLGDIDKPFIRHWLRWAEKEGPVGGGPIPSLSVVNRQAPTAELRPQDKKQVDEDDLMPYPVLDAIEDAMARDKLTPVEAYRQIKEVFPEYKAEDLGLWTERYFEKWTRNQWKRERYAPSFHLDDHNLDPKTGLRFPILSGGFKTELAELKEIVARDSQAERPSTPSRSTVAQAVQGLDLTTSKSAGSPENGQDQIVQR